MAIRADLLRDIAKIASRPDTFTDMNDGGLDTLAEAVKTVAKKNAALEERIRRLEGLVHRPKTEPPLEDCIR